MARHANVKPINLRRSEMTREHHLHPVPVAKPGEKAKHEEQAARVSAADAAITAQQCPNGCGGMGSGVGAFGQSRLVCYTCGFRVIVVVDQTVRPAEGSGFYRRAVRNLRSPSYAPKVVPLW